MTYNFKVIVEADGERWHAYCPALVSAGAATWGYTRQEALRNIEDVVRLVVDSLIEHGEQLPSESTDEVQILAEPRVGVIVSHSEIDVSQIALHRCSHQ